MTYRSLCAILLTYLFTLHLRHCQRRALAAVWVSRSRPRTHRYSFCRWSPGNSQRDTDTQSCRSCWYTDAHSRHCLPSIRQRLNTTKTTSWPRASGAADTETRAQTKLPRKRFKKSRIQHLGWNCQNFRSKLQILISFKNFVSIDPTEHHHTWLRPWTVWGNFPVQPDFFLFEPLSYFTRQLLLKSR